MIAGINTRAGRMAAAVLAIVVGAAGVAGSAQADGWKKKGRHHHRYHGPSYVMVPPGHVRYYAPAPVIAAPVVVAPTRPVVVYPEPVYAAPVYAAPVYPAPGVSIGVNLPLR